MKYDKCPKCGGQVFLVEYELTNPCHYDGTSEYACVNALEDTDVKCDWRIGRFCGKKLGPHEQEPQYCTGEVHVSVGAAPEKTIKVKKNPQRSNQTKLNKG